MFLGFGIFGCPKRINRRSATLQQCSMANADCKENESGAFRLAISESAPRKYERT